MSDAVPDALTAVQPPRDQRIVATAVVSVALHLALIGWLVLPRLGLPEPADPPAVNVDLVPPPELSSLEASSSLMPSSQEATSSAEDASSGAASSAEPSSAEPPSGEPSSAEPSSGETSAALSSAESAPSQASEAASSAAASTEPASSAAASAAASEPPASLAAPPVPMARPIVIPVAPSAASSEEASSADDMSASEEPSSAASEMASTETSSAASDVTDASALTTTDSGAAETIDETASEPEPTASAAAIPPSLTGALHAAKRYYLEAMLNAPAMGKAREAIKKLPPEKRLTQTCNIEAVGQIGNAGKGYEPDAVISNAFAKPVIDGSKFAVPGGAFRSKQKWYGIAYECTLSDDMSAVKSFSFRVGADVTAELKARVGE